jgi:hypothetical protein
MRHPGMDAHPRDAQLLRLANDAPAAFGELYRRHVVAVHGWFHHRLAWAAARI